jgi:hypothetical protein
MGKKSNIVDFAGSCAPPAPVRAPNKAKRRRAKKERQIEKDEARVDADLNRALDAMAMLAQNEVDPIAIFHRITPMEEEEIASNVEKSLEWLQRFGAQWRSYVQNRFIKTENITSGNNGQARAGRLYLVRQSD